MQSERYVFKSGAEHTDYLFNSIGPKGTIRKVVRYSPYKIGDRTLYNLGFGDLDQTTGKIDDFAISDNNDRDKVLATVAGTVLEFMKNYPEAVITAFGSTPSRTRLYQIAIQANLEDICQYLIIKGFKEGKWQDFEFHVNYEGFLVFNKK